MTVTRSATVTLPTDEQILITREFDAPKHLVYKAWTTPELFKRFPTPAAMAKAELPELEELIRTTGFFRNKAKSIKGAAQTITEAFGGKVPETLDELTPQEAQVARLASIEHPVVATMKDHGPEAVGEQRDHDEKAQHGGAEEHDYESISPGPERGVAPPVRCHRAGR